MAYCPKCGNQVEENMTFCPRCGAPLKVEAQVQAAPVPSRVAERREKAEKGEKGEKHEKQEPEKGEKHEKSGEFGFVGFLVAGLILVLIGTVAYANAVGWLRGNFVGPAILLIIGVLIIVVGVYATTMARRRSPSV
jgi:hypothetical protein